MKRLVLYIVISLLCLLKQTTFAIESSSETKQITLSSLEDHIKEGFVPSINASLIDIQKNGTTEYELRPNTQKSWLQLGEEPSINCYFSAPPINNKNNIYYKGNYKLEVSEDLIHLLDSVTNVDNLYDILEDYLSVYSEYTNITKHTITYELKRFREEKKLEATVNLVWPLTVIISLIFIFIYYDKESIRHPFTLLCIAAVIMTFNTLPDILIMLKGAEYSVINALGN